MIGLMLPPRERHGRTISLSSIPAAWSSSTKLAPAPKMARLHGRAPRGERLVGKIPHGTTTFVAGLRSTATPDERWLSLRASLDQHPLLGIEPMVDPISQCCISFVREPISASGPCFL
jgi:hypothetical protein